MKEIEVKAKITDIKSLTKKLIDIGFLFDPPRTQEDTIFLPLGIEYCGITKGTPVVRVRDSNGIISLTLKKRIISNNELIKLEKETVVSDKQQALEIVEHMGFHEVVRVNKKRTESKLGGMTVCIDEVEDLGSFIEVERLSYGDDHENIQSQLSDFLQTLGVGADDRITKGYDTLIYEKTKIL